MTIWLYVIVPKGFFPSEDTGYLVGVTEAATDTAFPAMVERQRKVADIVRADRAVAYVNSTVGAGGPNSTANSGRMFVALKPRKERGESATQVIQRLRRSAGAVTGIQIFFQSLQNINIGGRISKSQYQYTLQSNDTEALYRVAPELRDKIAAMPGLLDVTTDLYIKNPQITVEIDREKAAVYGVSVDQIRQELFNAFGSRQVATIYTPANDYQVILETAPEFQSNPNDLSKIYLKTSATGGAGANPGGGVNGVGTLSGPTIPLTAVTRLVPTVGPLQVNHQGQQPSVTISFNLAPGVSLGHAVDAIQKLERDERLPATITTGFQGTAQVFQESLKGQGILILAAVFAAYIVLGILYESFIHPITIISGLPSAGIGAILTLMLFQMDLSVIAMIGIVMLVGIVKKNAIMMIDFAIERRRVGLSAEAAIREACLLRFRPDHDDDLRRDLRLAADCARHRRRRRIAPAARRRRGRRIAAVAIAHALHHAGGLSLSRSHRPPSETVARTAGGRGGGRAQGPARRRRGITAAFARHAQIIIRVVEKPPHSGIGSGPTRPAFVRLRRILAARRDETRCPARPKMHCHGGWTC